MGFSVAQKAKNLPALWEISVRYLAWEDPLEKGMATYSSILARRTPWTEDPRELVFGVAQSHTLLSDFERE